MAFLIKKRNKIHIKYYDKLSGRHKEFSTKINATKEGWAEARRLLREFNKNEEFKEKYQDLVKKQSFSEGVKEFLDTHKLKNNTIKLCNLVKGIMIEVNGDKSINEYGNLDYRKLLNHFDKKNLSINTQGIYTAHLHSMFEYFKEMGYTRENPIKVIKRQLKPPESIDDGDLRVILSSLYAKEKKDQYYLIMFLLITGFRISTALELKWEDVDWENEFIIAPNVKRDRTFFFPITEDLRELLKQMGIRKEGKIFNYRKDGLKFFRRLQERLLNNSIGPSIRKMYSLHQLRKTFITKLLEQGIPIHTVRALADHSNISTTINYYAAINVKKIKAELDRKGIFTGVFGGNFGGQKKLEGA